MTKVLTVDDVEIEFEKQNSDHACKWCIYIRLRKSDKEQTLLMIRTNNKPYTVSHFILVFWLISPMRR